VQTKDYVNVINFIEFRNYFNDQVSFPFAINESTYHDIATFFPITKHESTANFVNSHVDDAHVDTYHRTFVNAVTKGDRTHEEEGYGGSQVRRRGENSRGK